MQEQTSNATAGPTLIRFGRGFPKQRISEDRLGYAVFSRALAHTIYDMAPDEGVMLTIHGPWGSGKTSAVNMTVEALQELQDGQDENRRIEVVYFNPWHSSVQEDLVQAFFFSIAAALDRARISKSIVEGLKAVGRYTAGALDAAGKLSSDSKTLADERASLCKALRSQSQRILVIVDDVDRLSPDNARQLSRMVKSVANLPNVMHLLVSDRATTLAETGVGASQDGTDWLDNIVHAAFDLPSVQPAKVFDLLLKDLLNVLAVLERSIVADLDFANFLVLEAMRPFEPELYARAQHHGGKLAGRTRELNSSFGIDLSLRDQREILERPFFSLSKKKRITPINYTSKNGDIFVKVLPHLDFGMATIWDADILLLVTSVLNEQRKCGVKSPPRTIHFHPHDLLKAMRRRTGGREYKLLHEALGRLQATTVVTNIRASRGKKQRQFSWIESWADLQDEHGASCGMTITVSEWFSEGIFMPDGLLTIDPLYFSITSGRKRWLYRVVRKHAGGAGLEGFAISLPVLFEKSGAEGPYRRFKFEMQAIVRDNNLPGFDLIFEFGKNEPLLRMMRRDPLPVSGGKRCPVPTRPAQLALPPAALVNTPPTIATLPLSTGILDRIGRDFPGWDLQELKGEFDAWVAGSADRVPANYEAAFYGFVRRKHARPI